VDYQVFDGENWQDFTALVRALIAWFIDDLRGLAGPSGAFYAPATRGTCMQCMLDATRIGSLDVTVWPGACKHITPSDSAAGVAARRAFKGWYAKSPVIAALADGVSARPMTKAFAERASLDCMRACEAANGNEAAIKLIMQGSYWKEVDIWSELLPYWDRVLQNVNDPAHEIYNIVKSLIGIIGNLGSHKLSTKRRAFLRGQDQIKKGEKVPWHNTNPNQVPPNCAFQIVTTNCSLTFQPQFAAFCGHHREANATSITLAQASLFLR
jgi:hypothetical protein